MLNYIISRYADQISIGNEVLVQANNQLTPVTVMNVSTLSMQGKQYNMNLTRADKHFFA